MKKHYHRMAGGIALFLICHPVWAINCTGTVLSQADIQAALSGRSIQAKHPTTGEEWKEDHCANGKLFKVGSGSTADPRAQKGTWSTATSGTSGRVSYTYFGATPITYTFAMRRAADGTLQFCSTATFPPQQEGIILNAGPLTGPC